MADGEWLSATMGEFTRNPMLEIVHEDGRPSYFREKIPKLCHLLDGEKPTSNQQAPKWIDKYTSAIVSDAEAVVDKREQIVEEKLQHQISTPSSPYLSESQEEKITELARTLSYHGVKNENGELINPFFGSDHPLLDPSSGKFSTKAWLETIMSITSRDSARYPQRVAGVAYKNLSAHGFGEPTNYQTTFGNYPFRLLSFAKRLIGKHNMTRIQILKDFEGLVKSGEMLLVLGRPGRQVILWKNRNTLLTGAVVVRHS